jgi:hypothetical protein
MTSSIHSLQEAHSQSQTQEAVQPHKTLQTHASTQHDTVTISQEAKQALTHSTTQAGGGGANDYTDSH